jgi:hypothetical protein
MRLRKFLAVLLTVVGIIVVGVWVFDPGTRPGFVRFLHRSARGYRLADSPEQAVASFQRALQERDYRTAALYCSRDYSDHLEQAAEKARRLGEAIDNLRYRLKSRNVRSDPIDVILFWLDPFPAGFTARDFEEDEGDGRWTAILSWEADERRYRDALLWVTNWGLDPTIHHALLPCRLLPEISQLKVEVRQDDDEAWRIVFPIEMEGARHVQASVARLQEAGNRFRDMLTTIKNDLRAHTEPIRELEMSLRNQHLLNQ